MTLYWSSVNGFIRGHTDTPPTLNNWWYDIRYLRGSYVADVCTMNGTWDILGTFGSVEEAKHFCEMYEATGART